MEIKRAIKLNIIICLTSFLAACEDKQLSNNNIDKTASTNNKVNEFKPYLAKDKQQDWFNLIGKTYLDQPIKNGGRREILAFRDTNGTYQFTFRTHDTKGNYKDRIEVGEWGVSGGIYFTIYKGWIEKDELVEADSRDPYNRDAYKIIYLDEKKFVYETMDGTVRYTAKLVPENFALDNN